jgi:hypothetical protein
VRAASQPRYRARRRTNLAPERRMSGPPDRLAVKIYDGGGAKASKRCGCCEGIEKGKGVQCIAFIAEVFQGWKRLRFRGIWYSQRWKASAAFPSRGRWRSCRAGPGVSHTREGVKDNMRTAAWLQVRLVGCALKMLKPTHGGKWPWLLQGHAMQCCNKPTGQK